MIKLNIIAPAGGFGNHIRWLVLLDSQFSKTCTIKFNKEQYENVAGCDWPDYVDFLQDNYINISKDIVQEIKDTAEQTITFNTLEEKINLIKNKIYTTDRTWHNWLIYEWSYRKIFDDIIFLDHEYTKTGTTSLILTVDPFLAYKCYVKFNSSLNNESKSLFINSIESLNKQHMLLDNSDSIQILDSTILYSANLDRVWYNDLITKLKLEDNYESANSIHQLWFDCHKRAEREIITDMINLYGFPDK